MLLNLSNHPLSKWDDSQRRSAEERFGFIEDLPFPQIDPKASLDQILRITHDYAEKCKEILANANDHKPNAVHLMGEFTFTYQFLKQMESHGILCVASTTERIVTENADGSKNTVFRFIQFRPYYDLREEN